MQEENIEDKIQKAKELIKQHTLKKVKVGNSMLNEQQISEHKCKKAKTRKRAKLQKKSRKNNRG